MKNLYLLLIPIFFIACNNNSKPLEESKVVSEIKKDIEEIKSSSFTDIDLSKLENLKTKYISCLNDSNKLNSNCINTFIIDFDFILEDYNDKLFSLENFEDLNTIEYAPHDTLHHDAIAFKKYIEKSGLKIDGSEGMIYLEKNCKYFLPETILNADSLTVLFTNYYCTEIEANCCHDASIVISDEEVFERAFHWGELIKLDTNDLFTKRTKTIYRRYIYMLMLGSENSEHFDYETFIYDTNLYSMINNSLIENPDSYISTDLSAFMTFLETTNIESEKEIFQFIESLFK